MRNIFIFVYWHALLTLLYMLCHTEHVNEIVLNILQDYYTVRWRLQVWFKVVFNESTLRIHDIRILIQTLNGKPWDYFPMTRIFQRLNWDEFGRSWLMIFAVISSVRFLLQNRCEGVNYLEMFWACHSFPEHF